MTTSGNTLNDESQLNIWLEAQKREEVYKVTCTLTEQNRGNSVDQV